VSSQSTVRFLFFSNAQVRLLYYTTSKSSVLLSAVKLLPLYRSSNSGSKSLMSDLQSYIHSHIFVNFGAIVFFRRVNNTRASSWYYGCRQRAQDCYVWRHVVETAMPLASSSWWFNVFLHFKPNFRQVKASFFAMIQHATVCQISRIYISESK